MFSIILPLNCWCALQHQRYNPADPDGLIDGPLARTPRVSGSLVFSRLLSILNVLLTSSPAENRYLRLNSAGQQVNKP